MTADHPLPAEELNRAILADGIARLEKELDAAEKRARDAEARAKEAKSALAEILLDKARGQKAARPAGTDHPSADDREVQLLRAELEAVRRDLQQQESKLQDARDDAAEALRLEYERRFHAARERMAQEFQKRLGDAEVALALDMKRQKAKEPAAASADASISAASPPPDSVTAEETPAAVRFFGTLGADRVERLRRHAFALPLAAFAGGLLLGWSALPGRSEPERIAVKDIPTAADKGPATDTASADPISPAATTPIAEPTQPTALSPQANETPPPSEAIEPSAPPMSTAAHVEPTMPQETLVPLVGDLQERNGAMSAEIDTLRRELDAVLKRVKVAESALTAERRKSADLARRAAAADRLREEQARADAAAASNRPKPPAPPEAQEPIGSKSLFRIQ